MCGIAGFFDESVKKVEMVLDDYKNWTPTIEGVLNSNEKIMEEWFKE